MEAWGGPSLTWAGGASPAEPGAERGGCQGLGMGPWEFHGEGAEQVTKVTLPQEGQL